MNLYSLRGVLKTDYLEDGQSVFEERIIVCQAENEEDAFLKGKANFDKYASDSNFELIGDLQLFSIEDEEVKDGSEVFSLLRKSTLDSDQYFNHFFNTGDELQRYEDTDEEKRASNEDTTH